ncbi:chitinase N-terminal domain-containing protein [Clostridium sp. VAP51]|uniref:chitinase N-terminal domain-containing protein n=1 Tax=Clostridium sp. VAP51 TaxID=2949978 RepID=UPI00207AFCD3|nr:chitinase N-terminal domain-containing protein [Clostridium sp. VAP51]
MSKKAKLITICATIMILGVESINAPFQANAETNKIKDTSITKNIIEAKTKEGISNSENEIKKFNNDITTGAACNIEKISTSEIDGGISNTTGVPSQGTLTKDKWAGECDYTITMSLWYGNNADSWRLYENGKLIHEEKLVNNSPSPQTAKKTFTNKANGEYTYTAELVNSFGTTVLSSSVTHKVTDNNSSIDIDLPDKASGTPAVAYKLLSEDEKNIQWAIVIANPNKNYTWAGNDFSAWGVKFNTSAKIISVDNAADFKQEGNNVTINLKQDERLIGLNTTKTFIVKAEKQGNSIEPTKLIANQIRGNVPYPNYSKLPSSWSKGKTDLKSSNLISDEKEYYNSNINLNTSNKLISYSPSSQTQITMGLPNQMPGAINGVNGLKVWMPSKYLAMGIATDKEVFKLNPNYMVGLSIKENFTCGLIPLEAGDTRNIVTVDGKQWSWPIEKKHPDGPFQQEKGNFNEVKKQYIDYLSPGAEHENIVTLKTGEPDDPSYVSAAISSGISITMTREFLYAIPKNNFEDFLKESKDPWAEFVLIDNAYNRGVFGLLQKNIFTTEREKAIKSTDLSKDYQLGGYASHIDTIKTIINEMDKTKDNIYDEKLTKSDIDKYLDELRKFYQNGTPTDDEWNAMTNDVHKAFDVLSKHWGDDTISYRYDFLTILRVASEYLPNISNPAPSGASWVDQVSSANK